MMYERLRNRVQAVRDNITLKSDYTEELDVLSGIESDMSVCRHLNNISCWQAKEIYSNIAQVRDWIKEETAD